MRGRHINTNISLDINGTSSRTLAVQNTALPLPKQKAVPDFLSYICELSRHGWPFQVQLVRHSMT